MAGWYLLFRRYNTRGGLIGVMKLKYRSARDFSMLVGLDCLGLVAAIFSIRGF